MSIDLDIRNLKTKGDLERKRADFFRLLKLQQRLNKEYDIAVNERAKNEQLGISPVPSVQRTIQEEVQDETFQRQMADKNLRTILRVDEAKKVLDRLRRDEIVLLNNNFRAVANRLEGETNIQATTFVNFFRRFLRAKENTEPIDLTRSEMVEAIREEMSPEMQERRAKIRRARTGATPETRETVQARAEARARQIEATAGERAKAGKEFRAKEKETKKKEASNVPEELYDYGIRKVGRVLTFPKGMTDAREKQSLLDRIGEEKGWDFLKRNADKFGKQTQSWINEGYEIDQEAKAMGGRGLKKKRKVKKSK